MKRIIITFIASLFIAGSAHAAAIKTEQEAKNLAQEAVNHSNSFTSLQQKINEMGDVLLSQIN